MSSKRNSKHSISSVLDLYFNEDAKSKKKSSSKSTARNLSSSKKTLVPTKRSSQNTIVNNKKSSSIKQIDLEKQAKDAVNNYAKEITNRKQVQQNITELIKDMKNDLPKEVLNQLEKEKDVLDADIDKLERAKRENIEYIKEARAERKTQNKVEENKKNETKYQGKLKRGLTNIFKR